MTPTERVTFTQLVAQIEKGHSADKIAQELDLPPQVVLQLLNDERFALFFETEKPSAFQAWKDARDAEEADEVVRTLARGNAVANYKALQKLVDGGTLKPAEEANYRIQLIKMAGVINEEVKEEIVKISPTHMAALRAGAKIVDRVQH